MMKIPVPSERATCVITYAFLALVCGAVGWLLWQILLT